MNLPINTIKTAGIAIPINWTKIEGKRLGKSDDMIVKTSLNTLVFICEIVLILLLDDIKIINFLHVKFFGNYIYYFYRNFISSFKKRSFRKFINKSKLHCDKLKKNRKNNKKFLSNEKSSLYNHEAKKYS